MKFTITLWILFNMAITHVPEYRLRPEDGKAGLPLQGITYDQAIAKAHELAKIIKKRVYIEGTTTLASADPK